MWQSYKILAVILRREKSNVLKTHIQKVKHSLFADFLIVYVENFKKKHYKVSTKLITGIVNVIGYQVKTWPEIGSFLCGQSKF